MQLVERLDEDFKSALKTRDQGKLSILRLVRNGIKNCEIEKRGPASDEDVIEVLQREVKQHHESIAAFEKAGRPEEVARLQAEVELLNSYLPPAMNEDELKEVIEKAIEDTSAASLKDMGKVMSKVMPQVKGRATGDTVGQMVRDLLN